MRKVIAVSVLLFLAVFSILVMTHKMALAEGAAQGQQSTAAKIKQITGGVVAGDAQSAGILTVKQGKKEVVLYVSDATKITLGAETKTPADLTAGTEVSVRYIEENGQNTAKSIVIIGVQ